jgi:undecaprenyl-diphosphatase
MSSLDTVEVNLVMRTMATTRRLHLCGVARTATRLGNGWIYPLLSLVLLLITDHERPVRVLASSAISLALAFTIYPSAKRLLARTRPCDFAPLLVDAPAPLDRYSCPSGHAMTAAAYAFPLIAAWPTAAPVAIAVWLVIGWSRVAVGHHYVSDVVAGSIFGCSIAAPVVAVML